MVQVKSWRLKGQFFSARPTCAATIKLQAKQAYFTPRGCRVTIPYLRIASEVSR